MLLPKPESLLLQEQLSLQQRQQRSSSSALRWQHWDPHRCYRFIKLDAALALRAQNGGAWRSWAEDVPGDSGAPKQYWVGSTSAMSELLAAMPGVFSLSHTHSSHMSHPILPI